MAVQTPPGPRTHRRLDRDGRLLLDQCMADLTARAAVRRRSVSAAPCCGALVE